MTAGRVLGVEEQRAGSSLRDPTGMGSTWVILDDVSDFAEDGGTCVINGTTYTYLYASDYYSAIEITPPLVITGWPDDRCDLEGLTRWAMVSIDDADDGPILARVPHALFRHMVSGIRDEADREAVEIEEEVPGSWVVKDVLGRSAARIGLGETDWRNSQGVPIIVGDPNSDTDWSMNQTWDFFGAFAGPLDISLPAGGSGTVRQIGELGQASGAISFTTYVPVKITASGLASITNNTGNPYNVKFFLMCVDSTTSTTYLGRQTTQHCPADDGPANDKHRQVSNQRQIYIYADETTPHTVNFWWGFQNTTSLSRAATVRNCKMTLRVAYAPDVPPPDAGPTDPRYNRSPVWARSADTKARYLTFETDDTA